MLTDFIKTRRFWMSFWVFLCLVLSANAHAVSSLQIRAEHMTLDGMEAKNAKLTVRFNKSTPTVQVTSEIRPTVNSAWGKFALACERFNLSSTQQFDLHCEKNIIQSARLTSHFRLNVQGQNNHPTPASLASTNLTLDDYQLDLHFWDSSFTDEQGLHAGEKLSGQVTVKGSLSLAGSWGWQTDVVWQTGGVFWQPFYLESQGHHLHAKGLYSAGMMSIEQADLVLENTANLHASAQVVLPNATNQKISFNQLRLQASEIDLAKLYPLLLKPLLDNGAFSNLEMAGQARLSLFINNGALQEGRLTLQQADVEDKSGRFAFHQVNADIPWSYDDLTQAQVAYQSGHFLHIPLGVARLNATLSRNSVTAKQLDFPIIDGALKVSDVSAALIKQQWHWHMRAELTPIDMVAMSQAVAWPRMEGKVAASIPLVTYSNGELTTDGEMKFSVFNGNIRVQHLAMNAPLGTAPKLTADLQMRNLDLGDLTRTFSFGAIEGKLDGEVNNLVLSNWQPVSFDANFYSGAGRYPKKISQRAVENISALGGAGAAAAVQRSFLRFLKEFNYEKIGLSCQLINDTCEMNGVESTPQGYIIVKGSGIPAITVMGYNHSVGWSELIARVKRITADNAAVIQ